MKELFDQIINEIRGMWRYRRLIVVASWVLCVVGWAGIVALPDMYRAEARIQVDTSSTLAGVLGEQIVAANVQQQLQMVRQALLGSVQLLKVARTTGLDAGVDTDAERAQLVSELLKRLNIYAVGQGQSSNRQNLYRIEYLHSDRQKAVEVVNELVNTFIEDTIRFERDKNEAARDFIEQQIAETELRLRESEDRLAAFKRENSDKLPGSEGGYFIRLQSLRDDLAESRRLIRIATSRKDRLELQLAGEASVVPTNRNTPPPLENSLDGRIRQLESRLQELLLDYTERHPDVIAASETLDRLKAERQEQLEGLGLSGSDVELAMLDDNPVHQAIRIALNEADVEIATLEADISDQEASIRELQSLIDEVPEVEAEFARLNRDYEVVQQRYQDLVESRETQDLSIAAYDSGEVDFKLIDPPVASIRPVSPNRLLLFAATIIGSLGACAGLAMLLSQMRPVIHDTKAVRNAIGLPVLGSVSSFRIDPRGLLYRHDIQLFALNVVLMLSVFFVLAGIEVAGPGVRMAFGVGE